MKLKQISILFIGFLISNIFLHIVKAEQSIREFTTVPESFFIILLYGLWVFFLFVSVLKRGQNGRPIILFALFQMFLSWVAGTSFMHYSILIGIGTIAVGVVTMIASISQK